jgi:hypothetical protein
VVQDGIHRHLVAVDDVEDPVGQAGLLVQLGDPQRDRRVALGRLEDEGVAAGDRDRVHPHRDHDREVERGDPGRHPDRLADRVAVDLGGDVLGEVALEQVGDAGGDLHDLHAALDLAGGVGHDLAVLGGDDPGQLVPVALEQLQEPEHHPGPLDHRGVAPGRVGGLGRLDGGVDVVAGGVGDLGGLLPGGRVIHGPGALGRGGDDLAVDPVVDGPHGQSSRRVGRYR